MLKRSIGALLLCCSLGLGVARAADKPTLALVGGQVIDGYEGPPIHDGVVLIAGERIVAVGRRGEIAVPAGHAGDRHRRDERAAGADGHARPPDDPRPRRLRVLGQDVHGALPRRDHADRGEAAAQSGVTTVRDLGAPLEEILHVKRRIEKGEIPGPRLFVSGPFIQHGPYFEYEKRSCAGASTGPTDARAKVQKLDRRGRRLHQADRPGPDGRRRGRGRRRDRAQGRQAGRRARPPRGGDPDRPEARRRLLRAHRARHRAGLSRGHPGRPAQAQQRRSTGARRSRACSSPTTRRDVFPERLDDPRWQRDMPKEIAADIRRSLGTSRRSTTSR